MEQVDTNIVIEIKEKIKILINQNQNLKEENKKIIAENKRLIDDHKENKKEFSKLEDKFDKIKLAKSILNTSTDTHEAKLKINRIVREIDKCIALLNK